MTDKLPPLLTPIAPPSQTLQPSPSFPAGATVQDDQRKQEAAEEEPYTIKCICSFPDDDGNTIFCETCETWQHIECYYPHNMEDAYNEDFAHSCADCDPRPLDRQQAIERQRAKINVPVVTEVSDKKPKRPPSKSHKKKPKPSELQINGHVPSHTAEHHTKHAGAHDIPHQPPKKTKNSHKHSQSISAPAPKRSPSDASTSANANNVKSGQHQHPPSPATTPPDLPDGFEIHAYPANFRSLANGLPFRLVHTNSFAELSVSKHMSDWLRDDATMKAETGWSRKDIFQKLPPDANSKIKVEANSRKKLLSPGIGVQWHCLTATMPIRKDVPLMEVNGMIGLQNSYCADPQSRWEEFTSPLPFVLFHPALPLYIDFRKEASKARYVRRSCRPNAVLETFLSEEHEYRFWLVSDREIAAEEQITIPWDFRFPTAQKARTLRILGLADESEPDVAIDETEYNKLANWVHLVLSEFGGCACDLGTDCAFSRFHRKYLGKNQHKKTKKRRPKSQHAISPTSTGHATNSRGPSEGHLEDAPEHGRRSISGSSRSIPPSRDMTPTARQGSFDTLGILTEPTDRDKRKVAMVEDSFRRMEQQQPPRKRKRVSDGTTTSQAKGSKPASAAQTLNLPNGFADRLYVDAGTGTSRSKSGSPTSPHTVSAGHRKKSASRTGSAPAISRPISAATTSNYRDAAVQTDPESEKTVPLRRVVSGLRKRCLDNRHHFRVEEEERRKRQALQPRGSGSTTAESPVDSRVLLLSPVSSKGSDGSPQNTDTPMHDALPVASTTRPGGGTSMANPLKHKSPDLRVQMPPIPPFGGPVSVSAPNSAPTPLSAGGSVVQSPFSVNGFPSPFAPPSVQGVAATPSPVKKKMSLSDYKSRMNKTRPGVGTSLKPVSNTDDPKSATSADTNSPTVEKGKEKGKEKEEAQPTKNVASTSSS